MRRLAAGLLAMLVLLPLAPPAPRAEADPATLRAEIQALTERTRATQAEIRDVVARVRAFAPDTPLKERQAHAERLLELRRTLEELAAALAAKRTEIATLPDWYVVTIQGAGVSTMRSSLGGFLVPELDRRRGALDVVLRVEPGHAATDRAGDLERALAPPACRRGALPVTVAASAPEFWETLRVDVSGGPFGTRAEAEARRRPGDIATVEVVPYPNPNQLLRQFGCPEQPLRRLQVADVSGQTPEQAEAALRAQGLVPVTAGGGPAPSEPLEFKVQGTRPAAGGEVSPGEQVVVLVHSRVAGSVVPPVTGLAFDEAVRRLANAGLTAERADAGIAPGGAQPGAVARQDAAAGARLARGAVVRLWVHGAPAPTREQQVAATQCPASAQAYWDEAVGSPRCRCAAGFMASGVACVVDSRAAVAGLRCPANAQGVWNEATARAECRCLAGFVTSGAACVVDRNAAVAAHQCPLLAQAFWDDRAGQPACRCMAGFAWNGPFCAPDSQAAIAALKCPANAEGYWEESSNRAQCRCRGGFVWSAQAQACVGDRNAAVAGLTCAAGAEAYWDERQGRAQCRCRQGFVWNGQACASGARPPQTPAPPPPRVVTPSPPARPTGSVCPPGQVLHGSSSPLGQGDAWCGPAPRR